MATWKKILREDYAVGTTNGLLRFDSDTDANVISLRLWDNRNNGSVPGDEGQGLETVGLTFQTNVFSVSGTTINLAPLNITDGTDPFTVYDGTNDTITFSSSDSSITVSTAVDGTVDLVAASSTITGNVDSTGAGGDPDTLPDSVTFNLGDNITLLSSSNGVLIGPIAEASGEIVINFQIPHTTLTGTLDSSTDNYEAGVDDITFAGLGTAGYLPIASSVSGTTISLGIEDERIEDLVGAMVAGNTEHGITVTYADNGAGDGKLNFDLSNLVFATNSGNATVDYSAGSTITIQGATNSGITTAGSGTTVTIDQADFIISGNENGLTTPGSGADATKNPTGGILFGSSDSSVTVTASGGGTGTQAVSIDLKAKPQITDIADVATGTTESWNISMTSATGTGDYNAFLDAGKLTWSITDVGGTETATLGVQGNAVIAGDLTVQGDTTTLNTQTVTAEDQLIVLGLPSTAYATDAAAVTGVDGGGIVLASTADVTGTANTAEGARLTWNSTGKLTGWEVADTGTSGTDSVAHTVAVMDHADGIPTVDGAGVGTFYFDTDNAVLYVAVA